MANMTEMRTGRLQERQVLPNRLLSIQIVRTAHCNVAQCKNNLPRYYDSRTGTFCAADPLAGSPGDPQSWNRYPYGRNDPIDVTDPSGQSWWSDALAVLGAPFTGGASLFLDFLYDNVQAVVNNQNPTLPFFFGASIGGSIGASSGGVWNDKWSVPYGGVQGALGLPTMQNVGGPINNLTQGSGRTPCPPWTVILTGVSPKQARDKSPITGRRSGSGDAAIDPRDFGESDWYQLGNLAMNKHNPLAARKAANDQRNREADDIKSAGIQITPDWGTATDPMGSKMPSANGTPSGFPTSGPMGGNDIYGIYIFNFQTAICCGCPEGETTIHWGQKSQIYSSHIYSPSRIAHGHIDTYGWLTDRLANGSTRRVTVNISLIPPTRGCPARS